MSLLGHGAPQHPPQRYIYPAVAVILKGHLVLVMRGTDVIAYFDNRQDAKVMTSSTSSGVKSIVAVTTLLQVFHMEREIEKDKLIQQKLEKR